MKWQRESLFLKGKKEWRRWKRNESKVMFPFIRIMTVKQSQKAWSGAINAYMHQFSLFSF